jgi:Flp pilus assembly protein TadG
MQQSTHSEMRGAAAVARALRLRLQRNLAAFFNRPSSHPGGRDGSSGASAVEFALVVPVFLILILGLIAYATVESIYIGTQQLVSQAARASVAGLSDTERTLIVTNYISSNIGSYAFLDPNKISVTSKTINTSPSTYQVNVTYDMSGSFVYQFKNLIPLPSPTVQRTAVVLNGGA